MLTTLSLLRPVPHALACALAFTGTLACTLSAPLSAAESDATSISASVSQRAAPTAMLIVAADADQASSQSERVPAFVGVVPGGGTLLSPVNLLPAFTRDVRVTSYDGDSDDLLTAGLGKTGLAGPAPAFADPLNPTAAELRRNAIHANYRAVLDIAANSGYGTLYGPNVDANGVPGTGEGKVAGKEYIATFDGGSGRQNVTLMVQIPASFDRNNPCIVTGTSSGSRGIYGAIGSSGEWGLKRGCAVAYTDKGTGTGLHTFDDDTVNLRNGVRATASAAGRDTLFTDPLDPVARQTFASSYPNRISFKHAYSQQNPERDWGRNTLEAVVFAFYALNEEYGNVVPGLGVKRRVFTPPNTLVIGSSISNGGGAAVRAAEQDLFGLIDAVAVTEPQIQPRTTSGYTVQENGQAVAAQGKSLPDVSTFGALYQPCIAGVAARCASLVAKGLLSGADLAAQQADARARLRNYGWTAGAESFQSSLAAVAGGAFATFNATTNNLVAVTYANAYGRFSPTDRVCGFTFAAVDAGGNPVPLTPAARAGSFATQNGIIGTPVFEEAVGGAKAYTAGFSPSTAAADWSLDGFLCLRALATGADPVSGAPLSGTLAEQSRRVREGVSEVLASGNLRGKPVLIVAGRNDYLVPVNHVARAYLGLNAATERGRSRLSYIEVTNANHFDAFTSVIPAANLPLHVYLFRALDAVYAHLKTGAPLPPSQVVRTVPRSDATTPVSSANLPPIATTPTAANRITVTGTTVNVPD